MALKWNILKHILQNTHVVLQCFIFVPLSYNSYNMNVTNYQYVVLLSYSTVILSA